MRARRLWNDRRGQALVEYALILALVALAAVGGLSWLGQQVNEVLTDVANRL
ncbi:MAG: Flp family type IVb pilin [Firmicutes bacterium]|nr:Flp family type IVb pilin [Bacillota bacterium]